MKTLRNPFTDNAPLNHPIAQDALAELFFRACEHADAGTHHISGALRGSELAETCSMVQRYRWDASPMHPVAIRQRFRGITTSILLTISELYCDRVGRSVTSILEIMGGFAAEAGVEALDPLAVWALCMHFEDRRREKQEPTIEWQDDPWRIEVLHPPLRLIDRAGKRFTPEITVAVDNATGQVIASHIDCPESNHAFSRCLYDAIAGQRMPSTIDRAGVQWRLPRAVLSESQDAAAALHSRCQEFPFSVAVRHIDPGSPVAQTIAHLRGDWTRDLHGRETPVNRFEQLFDNYLWRFHGNGPARSLQEKAVIHSNLTGYNQDPADLYPALRRLLPSYPGRIESGAVHHEGLTYEDPLLRLWPGRMVSVLPSQAAEAHAWVYIDGSVICKASAAELRRMDGSYRSFRERR